MYAYKSALMGVWKLYSCEIRRSCHLGLLFERECSTKEKGFIEAIWKNKLLKPHMVSGPLDVTNDTWIKSQGSHCKKGILVGVHPYCRIKMAEKSSLFLPCPSHKCVSKGVCRGRRSWHPTCTVLLPLLCSVLPASLGAGWRRERSWLKVSSRAWWKAGHGFPAGLGQPSSFMAGADPGVGALLNTEPMWTNLFCRCKNVRVYLGQAVFGMAGNPKYLG